MKSTTTAVPKQNQERLRDFRGAGAFHQDRARNRHEVADRD